MDGLLNYRPDPIAQGLLGFAGGMLTPRSRGGGIGAGLLGANQGMEGAVQQALQMEQMRRQAELQRARMENEQEQRAQSRQLFPLQLQQQQMAIQDAERARAAAAANAEANAKAMELLYQDPRVASNPAMQAQARLDLKGLLKQLNPDMKFEEIFDKSGQPVKAFVAPGQNPMIVGGPKRNLNDLIQVGPDGTPQVNQLALNAKSRVASAGATRLNIPINTERTYYGNMAEGLAKQDIATLDAAKTAPDRVATAQRIRDALSKNPITGTAAEQRLGVHRALATVGLVDPKQVAATEGLQSELASMTLDAIKTSGLGSGQGFTDKDRQFLELAKSGRIDMTPQNIMRVADLNEKAARATYQRGAEVSKRLRGAQGMGEVSSALELPPLQSQPAQTGIPSMDAIDAEIARRRGAR